MNRLNSKSTEYSTTSVIGHLKSAVNEYIWYINIYIPIGTLGALAFQKFSEFTSDIFLYKLVFKTSLRNFNVKRLKSSPQDMKYSNYQIWIKN